jgi:hypothetical protein
MQSSIKPHSTDTPINWRGVSFNKLLYEARHDFVEENAFFFWEKTKVFADKKRKQGRD